MSEQEIKEAIADLHMLWGDVEWWEEMGLSRVRPTLKAAADAARQLTSERDEARAEVDWFRKRDDVSCDLIKQLQFKRDEALAEENGLLTERDQARSEIELLKRDVARLFQEKWESIKERDEARAEVEQWKWDYNRLSELCRSKVEQVTKDHDAARAEVERLKDHIPDATKMIRPEPSRLEIAAMFKAAWLSNTDYQFEDACDDGWWIEQADALIAAAKGGAE